MAEANTSPVVTAVTNAGSALAAEAGQVADKVATEVKAVASGWWTKGSAWVKTQVDSLVAKVAAATKMPEGVVRLLAGALAVGFSVFLLTAMLHRSPEPKKPVAPAKHVEVTVPAGPEKMATLPPAAVPVKTDLDKINELRHAAGAPSLKQESLLDGEAMNIARKLLTLKGDAKAEAAPISEVAAATYAKIQRINGVGQADFDAALAQWQKSVLTGTKLTDKAYDRVGIAHIHDTNTFWKDHWVMVLAKAKK